MARHHREGLDHHLQGIPRRDLPRADHGQRRPRRRHRGQPVLHVLRPRRHPQGAPRAHQGRHRRQPRPAHRHHGRRPPRHVRGDDPLHEPQDGGARHPLHPRVHRDDRRHRRRPVRLQGLGRPVRPREERLHRPGPGHHHRRRVLRAAPPAARSSSPDRQRPRPARRRRRQRAVRRRRRAPLPLPRRRRLDIALCPRSPSGSHEFLPWYSSVHRGAGWKSQLATAAYEEARAAALRFAGRAGIATTWPSSAATRPRPSTTSPTGSACSRTTSS